MNSENIFLSKQIEQVDITDPSIDQRGKTNKPSLQKPEGFLCSKFKDVSPAMQWQKGAQCRWQKGYAHHEGSWPWGREIASAPGQGTGHCLLPPGYSSSLVSKWHQITAWNVCRRLEPEQRIDWPAPARSCRLMAYVKSASSFQPIRWGALFFSPELPILVTSSNTQGMSQAIHPRA